MTAYYIWTNHVDGGIVIASPLIGTLYLAALLSSAQDVPSHAALDGIRQMADAGRAAEAETQARIYVKSHGDSADAHFLLGYVLFKEKKPLPSLAEFTEGAKLQAPSARDLQTVASDYVLLKDYPDADKWFTKALEWDPSNFQLLYFLGRTKYYENRFEEAVALFTKCLALRPANVKAEDNLGLTYQGLGRMEEAEAAFRKAIAWQQDVDSKDFGPFLNLGSLLVDAGRPEEGLGYLKSALAIDADEVRIHRALGKAYLHLNQLETAQAELERSVALSPEEAPTHFVLAQVYRKRGMQEQARQQTEIYSKLSGSHSTAESFE